MTLNFSPNPDGHYNLIASPDGRQITMISSDKGDVLVSTASRRNLVSIGHVQGDRGGNGERGCVGHDAPVRIDVKLDGNRDRQMDGSEKPGGRESDKKSQATPRQRHNSSVVGSASVPRRQAGYLKDPPSACCQRERVS